MELGLLLLYLISGDKELSFLSSNLSIWSRVMLCRLSFQLDAMGAIYSDPACGFLTLSTEPSMPRTLLRVDRAKTTVSTEYVGHPIKNETFSPAHFLKLYF